MVKFGIIGAGDIANVFAEALNAMGGEAYAVASRDYHKATEFKQRHGFTKAYGSYEAMLEDPEVDCVYIATPHALHETHMMLALSYDKHVLCEKPFTLNEAQAQSVFRMAKEKKRFVMEAMWTRFLPVIKALQQLINSGVIGDVTKITCDFCFDLLQGKAPKSRLLDLELGAGALLDIGIYNITFATLFLGLPQRVESRVVLHAHGMDETDDITFYYPNAVAHLYASISEYKPTDGFIYGTKGRIKVFDFFRTEKAEVYDLSGNLIQTIAHPHMRNGFEYEILEVIECINHGKLESDVMSHQESRNILKLMDALRADWNLTYPNEF